MRILHVIHSLDPRSGGPVATLRLLTLAQIRAGHQVTVVATRPSATRAFKFPKHTGLTVYSCRGFGRGHALRRFLYSREAVSRLRLILASPLPPHVVHIHGLFGHVTMAAAALARRSGIPYLLRPAGGLSPWCMNQGNRGGKGVLLRLFVKRDLLRGACVHATSQREVDDILRLLPRARIGIVEPPILLPTAEELSNAGARFRRTFSKIGDRPFVLFLSRLSAKKGIPLLLRAFAEIAPDHPTLMLVLAGADEGVLPETKRLIAKLDLKKRVRIVGHLDGERKLGALAAARMLVLPSRDENFGVVVAEAMAAGLPVVTTPGVDSHRLVDQALAGFTVPRNVSAIADGMQRVLDNDKEMLGAAGRELVRRRLCPEAIERRTTELYERALRTKE